LLIYAIVALSSIVLLIPSSLYAQNTGFSTACSPERNIKIDYPADNWVVLKDYTQPRQLSLVHTYGQVSPDGSPLSSHKAAIQIFGEYYDRNSGNPRPASSVEPANSFIQTAMSGELEDFQLARIGNIPYGEYVIQDDRFVYSNPAYLVTYTYTHPSEGSMDGITLVLPWGDYVYYIVFNSKPEITSELWPSFEQMIPTFAGWFLAEDRVSTLGYNC